MRNVAVVCYPINMTKSLPKVRVKHDPKFIRCRDPYAKHGLRAIIKIDSRHSYLLENAEAWKWLKRTDQTKIDFLEYFKVLRSNFAYRRHTFLIIVGSLRNTCCMFLNVSRVHNFRLARKYSMHSLHLPTEFY